MFNVYSSLVGASSMLLVVGVFALVIADVTGVLRQISATVYAFAMSVSIEAFLVRTRVLTRIGHTIRNVLVRCALKYRARRHTPSSPLDTDLTVTLARLGPPVEQIFSVICSAEDFFDSAT